MSSRSSIPAWIAALLITIYTVFSVLVLCCSSHSEKIAQIGDAFGIINALFSALALAAIIYSILLQRKDLNLQREELALTRKEQAEQTKQFEKMATLDEIQLLDAAMFEYLNAAKILKEQLKNNKIAQIHNTLVELIKNTNVKKLTADEQYSTNVREICNKLRYTFEEISSWANVLNNWFDRVDSIKTPEKHTIYKKRLLSFLSSDELFVLYFYFIYSSDNQEKRQKTEEFMKLCVMDDLHNAFLKTANPTRVQFTKKALSHAGDINSTYISSKVFSNIAVEVLSDRT